MKTNVKSLAFACGLAMMVLSWSAGNARAQGYSRPREFGRFGGHAYGRVCPVGRLLFSIWIHAARAPCGVLQSPSGPRAEGPDQLRAVL